VLANAFRIRGTIDVGKNLQGTSSLPGDQ
jgi:hypothetical protein